MRLPPNRRAKIITASHFPSANTSAVVTIGAVADVGQIKTTHCIRRITASHLAAQADALLTVVAGSTTIFSAYMISGGTQVFTFNEENVLTNNTSNEAVVITLTSAATTATLVVQYQ